MPNEKILHIEIMEDTRSLLVLTEYAIRAYKVRRGKKTQDMSGHNGPILKIIALEPEKVTKEKVQDDPK